MIKNFSSIIKQAQKAGKRRFAIAGAESPEVIKAAKEAFDLGIMDPILIGNQQKITILAEQLNIQINNWQIEHIENESDLAIRAAELLASEKADILAKGNMSTPVLLKAVLRDKYGLRTDRLLSHVSLMHIPAYHKMLLITDSGMVISPTFEQKVEILKNALDVHKKLGGSVPKVSVLAANEKVNDKMPETVDALLLVEKAKSGEFGEIILEGPMAVDMAFSKEAAEIKNFKSKTAGDPDILLMPGVACGNIFCKGLIYLAQSEIAGIIVGAKMPIVLISRAESSETMLRSAAFAHILSSN